MSECCGTCKYLQPIPFAMVSLCENPVSDYYHCDCDPRNDFCGYYEKQEKKEKN